MLRPLRREATTFRASLRILDVGPPIGVEVKFAVGPLLKHALGNQLRQLSALKTQMSRHSHRARRLRPAAWHFRHLSHCLSAATMLAVSRGCSRGSQDRQYAE